MAPQRGKTLIWTLALRSARRVWALGHSRGCQWYRSKDDWVLKPPPQAPCRLAHFPPCQTPGQEGQTLCPEVCSPRQ